MEKQSCDISQHEGLAHPLLQAKPKEKPMLKRKCDQCGNIFYSFSIKPKICETCKYKKYKKPKKQKFCPVCNQPFFSHNNRQIYCSPECFWKAKNLHVIQRKVCPICGKTFETFNSCQKFCDAICQAKADVRRSANRKPKSEPIFGVCLWCHKQFRKGRVEDHFYCCHNCGENYRGMREKIYKKYPFDHAKVNEEWANLQSLGVDYKIDG